jgi:hypothetical protein
MVCMEQEMETRSLEVLDAELDVLITWTELMLEYPELRPW